MPRAACASEPGQHNGAVHCHGTEKRECDEQMLRPLENGRHFQVIDAAMGQLVEYCVREVTQARLGPVCCFRKTEIEVVVVVGGISTNSIVEKRHVLRR